MIPEMICGSAWPDDQTVIILPGDFTTSSWRRSTIAATEPWGSKARRRLGVCGTGYLLEFRRQIFTCNLQMLFHDFHDFLSQKKPILSWNLVHPSPGLGWRLIKTVPQETTATVWELKPLSLTLSLSLYIYIYSSIGSNSNNSTKHMERNCESPWCNPPSPHSHRRFELAGTDPDWGAFINPGDSGTNKQHMI